jgi:hypothetical protein
MSKVDYRAGQMVKQPVFWLTTCCSSPSPPAA